jgi:hypothetical protein
VAISKPHYVMEFNVCPQKHPLPGWWADPTLCLFCDYSGGLAKLREKVGEMYGQPTSTKKAKDEKAEV